MIDGDKVANVIIEIMQENVSELGEIIAVDGKAIRSTSEKGKPHSALQILSAYMTGSGITIAQKSIHEKTNEIPVFQEMLDSLNVKNKTITADAMHCQTKTCAKIVKKQGDYVFGLKQNQPNFYEDVDLYFKENYAKFETFSTTEKSHGRIETRTCYKFDDIGRLSMKKEWSGLKSVFAVKLITKQKSGTSEEVSYYISSLDETPKKLMTIVREHWKIESLHWLLDVTFSEDECRVISENGLKTLNIFRKLALFLHRRFMECQTKKKSLKGNILGCLINDDLLVRVVASL
ncbi:putative transposase YncI [Clostridia bacterium]|nr:putative transposase YncI [Clostridia bacterium]